MTLDEKLGQLHQSVIDRGKLDFEKCARDIRSESVGSYIFMLEDPATRNRLQRVAVGETRLGIPLLFGMDVIHGYRTIFPISLGLSCAWDPELFEKEQSIAAREAKAAGIDWSFAPMSDMARDPRWGRVAETCGEDPYLTSLDVAAQVKGFQSQGRQNPAPFAACLKHFVGYGASVGGRDYNHTEIPEFILRNTHLAPFHAGVKAGAMTLMSSFNALDGIPAVANQHTLTDILRGEWGFQGFVVSDWRAVEESIAWGYAEDESAAARLSLSAGTDMEMLSNAYQSLKEQIAKSRISMAVVDEAVRRVLRVKFELGLFDRDDPDINSYSSTILQPDSIALAREAAAKSIVLLKNDGVLPISKQIRRAALIGPFADDAREMIGCWPGLGHQQDVTTLAKTLRSRLGDRCDVVQGCSVLDQRPSPENGQSGIEDAVTAARQADVAILALGEPAQWTGENASRATLGLTGHQQALFDAVTRTGKPVVVIVFCGRPLVLTPLNGKASAILVAWQPGVQAGNGLADVLFGDITPGGRLTTSWPADVGQVPVYYNRYHTGRPTPQTTNYRDMSRDPLYWFGYGLSYTTFEYSRVRLSGSIASATVKNTGSRTGEEVVQLYIRQEACHEGARPEQELRGFRRVRLEPGQETEVQFTLTDDVLGYYGRDGRWRSDSGSYQLWIAPHAHTGEPIQYRKPDSTAMRFSR
jgi:beta-glucosidase